MKRRCVTAGTNDSLMNFILAKSFLTTDPYNLKVNISKKIINYMFLKNRQWHKKKKKLRKMLVLNTKENKGSKRKKINIAPVEKI